MISGGKLSHLPLLTDELFSMRPVRLEDSADMFEYGSDEEVVKLLPWGPYRSLEEVQKGIENFFLKRPDQGLPPAYAIIWKENGKMIGTCDFHSVNREENSAGIGFVLNRKYWNRGIITKATRLLIETGRDYLELSAVTLDHKPENKAAYRIAEKLGFALKGLREHRYMSGQEAVTMTHWELKFTES